MRKQTGMMVCVLVIGYASAVSAVPISSSADPALAGATLIDFESVAIGYYYSLSLPGLTINGDGSPITICHGCGGGNGYFGDSGNSLNTMQITTTSFDILFDQPVSAFGLFGGGFNESWTYSAYDSNDNLLETLVLNNPCCKGFFNGIAVSGMHRVHLGSARPDWVVFDNLQYVIQTPSIGPGPISSAVPEPASLMLLTLGLSALGWSRKARN